MLLYGMICAFLVIVAQAWTIRDQKATISFLKRAERKRAPSNTLTFSSQLVYRRAIIALNEAGFYSRAAGDLPSLLFAADFEAAIDAMAVSETEN